MEKVKPKKHRLLKKGESPLFWAKILTLEKPFMKTIGIIGGGQLGRMMTQAAKKMGFHVVVLDPGENSPAGQVADSQIIGSWNDPASLRKLVESCDVATYDLEHVNTEALIELADEGNEIHPDPRVLAVIQDKLLQKQCIEEAGLKYSSLH